MSKKASLKDAFVRSVPGQFAVEPAPQEPIYTAIQQPVEPAIRQPIQESQPSNPLPSYPAIQPPAIPLPVYTAIHSALPPAVPKKKATFNLDASLHQRLKVAAAVHSREMVDIVADALMAYLPALDHTADSKQGLTR